ncbi:UbiA-like polyprenyltransferase [Humisphaera borealis]|uniref:4-hydroxybenzoate polyprenyltransferase n=1 Tax=Humisphaera borealis TaxID=2807512 RepID=A0A7M2WTN2_9BACT|nr:UbiA-like polyprenyltransferase [Humisphaera borealis]QOV87890.1 UbiA family prenyltransferase [Humisphaera borealis]
MTSAPTSPFPASPISIGQKLRVFAGDIKISHTVFALPFALLSSFLAASKLPSGMPSVGQISLVIICMIAARTLAMAANRLLDAGLDKLNPRTARRAIPSGALSPVFYFAVGVVCTGAFMAACYGFYILDRNPLPVLLGLPVLLFLCSYPFLKRFTRLCHYYLGAALALAPICAWVAIRGSIDAPPFWMAGAVLCWTAGFDIIYACQDYASDVATGVFSVPAKVGIANALWISRATHLLSATMLVVLGLSARPPLGTLYFIGVGLAIALLLTEHLLVKPNDLSKVGLAFFTINGVISIVLGTLGIADVLL